VAYAYNRYYYFENENGMEIKSDLSTIRDIGMDPLLSLRYNILTPHKTQNYLQYGPSEPGVWNSNDPISGSVLRPYKDLKQARMDYASKMRRATAAGPLYLHTPDMVQENEFFSIPKKVPRWFVDAPAVQGDFPKTIRPGHGMTFTKRNEKLPSMY